MFRESNCSYSLLQSFRKKQHRRSFRRRARRSVVRQNIFVKARAVMIARTKDKVSVSISLKRSLHDFMSIIREFFRALGHVLRHARFLSLIETSFTGSFENNVNSNGPSWWNWTSSSCSISYRPTRRASSCARLIRGWTRARRRLRLNPPGLPRQRYPPKAVVVVVVDIKSREYCKGQLFVVTSKRRRRRRRRVKLCFSPVSETTNALLLLFAQNEDHHHHHHHHHHPIERRAANWER